MSKPDIPPGERRERVVWQDSGLHISQGWQDLRTALNDFRPENLLVTTVGLVAEESDEVLVMGLSFSESTKTWFGLQVIAKNSIQSREELKV